jgi:predicted aspartyl protease
VIRGYLAGVPGRRRPVVVAEVEIPAQAVRGSVRFLIDTGADSTILAPRDAFLLGPDVSQLAPGLPAVGVGGRTPMTYTTATIKLDALEFAVELRELAPTDRSQRAVVSMLPSLLGRDVLWRFALFFEERRDRVYLLEPHEADALALP